MRVCVVDPSLFTLAYDMHLCAGLADAGLDVTLCGRRLRADEVVEPDGIAYEARCYPRTERGDVQSGRNASPWMKAVEHVMQLRSLGRWLHQDFDVIHFQWSPVPAVDRFMWRRLARDRTVVFTVHDTTPFLGQPTHRAQMIGWRGLLDEAHGLIVHTEGSRQTLAGLGVPAEKIEVVPHGPLTPRASVPEPRRDPGEVGRRTLLVFGEIKPYKGIDVLLRAVARLPREIASQWRVLIAGRPRCDLAELRALAADAGMPVEFRLGFVPDGEVPALFGGADLVVFPYRQIDASGALMLALPFGVPVVASRVGVFGESLEDGVTALLANPGDELDLARALERAMSDPTLRARLALNAKAHAARTSSWAAIGRTHADIYRKHLDARRGNRTARVEPTVRQTEGVPMEAGVALGREGDRP